MPVLRSVVPNPPVVFFDALRGYRAYTPTKTKPPAWTAAKISIPPITSKSRFLTFCNGSACAAQIHK